MKKIMSILLICICFFSVLLTNISAQETSNLRGSASGYVSDAKESTSILKKILLYIPNRILDILDIFRLRVRLGPGVAVGVRATDVVDLMVGAYSTLYIGLPGPRVVRKFNSPIGVETHAGVEISLAEASTNLASGPNYSKTEFGAGFQALLIGVDAGIDPYEIIDFVAGIFFLDLRKDDL